jgi:hypothetical protein
MKNKLPIHCPSCRNNLTVQGLICESCKTSVSGLYQMPLLLQLSPEQQQFIVSFVKSSGSLKDMASKMGLSYPTVRNMLDALINDIQTIEENEN